MPSTNAVDSLELKIAACEQALDGATASYLIRRGITKETAQRFRLGLDTTSGRLTIPYLSPAGPWLVKYRCLIDHDCKAVDHPKYLYTEGAGTHLFNTQTLLTADRVVLVEGELDAITAEQYGIPAVGYPGAGQWSSGKHKHWRWCFDSLDEVVIVADGDEPGKKSANTISDSLRDSVGAEVRVVVLPDGHDTNSFIDTYGDTAYLEELDWL